MNGVEISFGQLSLALVFILIAGAASLLLKLRLERDLLLGTVRTFAQLALMGYALKYIFRLDNGLLVLAVFAGMILFGAFAVRGRVKEKQVPYFLPTFGAMLLSYMLVTVIVTAVVVQVDPWYQPQYFITLGGMVIGNSMNALAITLERIFADVRRRRDEIELYLCLGANHGEATAGLTREAIRAGMIPSINAMMTVGIVFLPGMMTGQIIAGADPVSSIKYQIVVMLMLVGSTAIGSIIIALIARNRCFSKAEQLKI